MDLNRALEYALDGKAIVFFGAGFSLGAKNLRGEPIKSGSRLGEYFSQKCGIEEPLPLEDASEEFLDRFGESSLIEELKHEYTVREIADHHRVLAGIPWRRIYTTNYDNVVETADRRDGRSRHSVVTSTNIHSIANKEGAIVHVNGYVDQLNRDTLQSQFRLTDSSYAAGSVQDSQWFVLLRQDLRVARAVFFVGYSVADLDIKRLLWGSVHLHEKTFFVLSGQKETLSARRAARFGTVLDVNTEEFALDCSRKMDIYVPRDDTGEVGYSIEKYEAPQDVPEFSDRSVFDLLLLGNLSEELVWSSVHGDFSYYIERGVVSEVMSRLDDPKSVVVIHSELGNGKTLLLEGIKCRASRDGFDVFTISQRSEYLFDELSAILQSGEKTVIVIDNYLEWYDVIEYIGTHNNGIAGLVLSSRSSILDITFDRLEDLLGSSNVCEIPVDRMSEEELTRLSDLLDQYGMWGERAAWSKLRKMSFLQQECQSQFQAILLAVLQSPHILRRFSSILADVRKKEGYYEIVISILILAVLQARTTTDTLVDIWGDKVLEPHFRRDRAVRQILDMQHGEIVLRSSVAARFILSHVQDASVIIEVLIQMAHAADRASQSRVYWELLKSLTRFGNLQLFLPEKNRRNSVIRYYESVKNLRSCRNNPQFWLQYAIASTILEDFVRAEVYFQTAYSFAGKRDDYDTYMIDNHYARFLLSRATRHEDPNSSMAEFRKARDIINFQTRRDRLHYPYRVAQLYVSFYDTFGSRLSSDERTEIGNAASYVLNRISQLHPDRRAKSAIFKCAEGMEYILRKTGKIDDDASVKELS